MKHFVKFFVVTFFLLFCTGVGAEQKIVVMDLTYILNFSKPGKGAQEFLKKSYEDNLKKYSDMEQALKKEEIDLLSKKSVLSKDDYTKKSDTLRKKVIDYQSQRRASIDKLATQRAKARGIKEADYLKNNLLNKEVTAADVAESFYVQLCLEKTTANIITVDGGNIEASLR